MNIIKELIYIMGFSYIGNAISNITKIPMPGSVIGLILFFIFLQFKILKIEKVEKTSNFLLNNLGMLFIPAGVGIMVNFKYISDIWMIILLISIVTTIFSLIFVGLFTQYLLKERGKDE